jgi:5-hydroxyisourate hydrolase / 2-oxo-4-hydroxy-4-carboxy-5-ureidoimidazoline decarboxylase
MTLKEFNELEKDKARELLFSCCGSRNWVSSLMYKFPFSSEKELVDAATNAWYKQCNNKDWIESFAHHPQIGDKKSLQQKFAGKEQAGVASASEKVIDALTKANADYLQKFGFIFIVCATGKSAEEMLQLLLDRLKNDQESELNIAMGEQHKITLIRFRKLFTNANFQFLKMSQLTTHVLDTSIGRPGKNITVKLLQPVNNGWQVIAQGVTNADGRIPDLLPEEKQLVPGNYKLLFETGSYFSLNNVKGFYPEVEIQFSITDGSHYHVPLLINPFGYSTYRGS